MARPRGFKLSPQAWEDALNQAGLTLTQVAERSGVPRPTISGLLGGHSRASAPMTKALADTLSVHPQTLFPTLSPSFVEAA